MDELDDALKHARTQLDEARDALAKAKRRLESPEDLAARTAQTLKRAQAVEAEADDLAVEVERNEDHERRLQEELARLLAAKD